MTYIYLIKKNMGVIELSKINFNNESLFLSFIFVIRHEQKDTVGFSGGKPVLMLSKSENYPEITNVYRKHSHSEIMAKEVKSTP